MKRLLLRTETVRELATLELDRARGGGDDTGFCTQRQSLCNLGCSAAAVGGCAK